MKTQLQHTACGKRETPNRNGKEKKHKSISMNLHKLLQKNNLKATVVSVPETKTKKA
jgi:hypothetical protein